MFPPILRLRSARTRRIKIVYSQISNDL